MAGPHVSVKFFGVLLLNMMISSCVASPRSFTSYPALLPTAYTPQGVHSPLDLPVDGTSEDSESLSVAVEFSVLSFGAVGDGRTNDAQAFVKAWTAACASEAGYVHVPPGHTFQVHPVIFKGPCNANMAFKVEGNVVAPQDPTPRTLKYKGI
ncbi:unnamed protein product [Calypogeia fissa]